MTHTYEINGMHCQSCIAKVKSELLKLGDISQADIQLEPPQAAITMLKHIPVSVLNQAVSKAGEYTLSETAGMHSGVESKNAESNSWFKTYKPLILVFSFITLTSFLSSFHNGEWVPMNWMNNFMAGFFIAFSFFKFLDLKGFADSYSGYDLLAKKWYGYGYVYPFIELALGVAYLSKWSPVYTNLATMLVMSFSTIGVMKAVLNKRKIQCACLGVVFDLPMSTVTIIEDVLMSGMALLSLLLM